MNNFNVSEALMKGIEAHKSGDIQLADQLYTAILKIQPDHPDANHNMGLLAITVGQLDKAVILFKKALKANRSIEQFWISLVDAQIKLGQLNEAKKTLSEAIDSGVEMSKLKQLSQRIDNPKQPENYKDSELEKAINFFNKGMFKQALTIVLEIKKSSETSDKLLNFEGGLYYKLDELDKAVDAYKKAILINPNYSEAHNNLGIAYKALDRGDEALQSYKLAEQLDKKNSSIVNNIANIYREKGQNDEAFKHYKRAIELRSDFLEAHIELARLYNATGQYKEAVKSLEIAEKISPNRPDIKNELGNLFYENKDFTKAEKSYQAALKINPNFSDANFNLANLLFEKNEFNEALELYLKSNLKKGLAKYLECLLRLEEIERFNDTITKFKQKDDLNLHIAALSTYAAHEFNQHDLYGFCDNPLDFIFFSNIEKVYPDVNKFCSRLINECDKSKQNWEVKRSTTVKGYQSSGNIFELQDNKYLCRLKNHLLSEIKTYQNNFTDYSQNFIKKWPKKSDLTGWYVRLVQGGHQDSHIHPNGWLSGVVYLKTIESPVNGEGSISFSTVGHDLPSKNEKEATKMYQPRDGDIVLFPSTLFHKTIPVEQKVDRCVIAFDLIPR